MRKVEDWSLGYEILRPIGYLVHRMGHRSITAHGMENIPTDCPVIFAPNHQNALSDSLALILTSKLQVVFLGRADIFRKKLVARILNFFKISPVYRIRDGKDTLDRNQEVFERCVEILKKNKIICIYPEASHVGMKSMNTHKKAIPRIAMLAGERTNYELDVKVVPVGIYYSHYYRFRRDLIVCYGEPISSKDYYNMYRNEGEAKATLQFRNDLFAAIKKVSVNVDDRAMYDLYDQAFELMKPSVYRKMGWKNNPGLAVEAEQIMLKKLDACLAQDPPEKEQMLQNARLYKRLKQQLNMEEEVLEKGKITLPGLVLNFLLAMLLLPFSLYGILANGWLFYLTRYPYRHLIKDHLFYSTFAFGLGFILFPIWYLIQFFVLWAVFDHIWIALIIMVFSLPSGIIAWESGQLVLRAVKRYRWQRAVKRGENMWLQLEALRNGLKEFYQKLMD